MDKYSPSLRFKSIIQSNLGIGDAHSNSLLFPQKVSCPGILSTFPPVALFQGQNDLTVPANICTEMSEILTMGGARVTTRIYDNCSHTNPILEGPLSGDDTLIIDIIKIIMSVTDPIPSCDGKDGLNNSMLSNISLKESNEKETPMIPQWLAALARIINPF